MDKTIHVAFVIPFAFERFFQDVKDKFDNADKFENEILSKRNTWHFNWCLAMQNAGMVVTLYHLSMHGKSVREYTHLNGIKIKRIPANYIGYFSGDEFSFSLLRQISTDRPDIVFSVTHMMGAVCDMYDVLAMYCWLKKIPIVARNPGSDSYGFIFDVIKRKEAEYTENLKYPGKYQLKTTLYLKLIKKRIQSGIKYFVKKKTLRVTSLLIPQTQKDYNSLLNSFRVKKERLSLLPKPIDLSQFHEYSKEVAARKLGMDSSPQYILHVSNLFNTKGCEHIISLLPELGVIYPGIKLLVSGGGPKKGDLVKISKDLNVIDNVIFLGQIDHSDLVFYYNIADVFVLPTEIENEGQPNVIMEAIACNTPPISTYMAGPSSVIQNGLGLLIPKGNERALLEAIKKVLNGDFRINQKEREKFLNNYCFESVGGMLRDKFTKL